MRAAVFAERLFFFYISFLLFFRLINKSILLRRTVSIESVAVAKATTRIYLWKRLNGDLFTLTYGALVAQLVQDYRRSARGCE